MGAFEYRQAQEIRDCFQRRGVRYLFLGKSGAILLGFPDTTQDGMVVLLDCVADRHGVHVARVRYVPVFVNHPDFTVLAVGDALRKGAGDPALLRASYRRTVGVAGRAKGVEPVPEKLP